MDKNAKIAVTGGAGFIGSHIIEELNKQGYWDIIVLDDFSDGSKLLNLKGLKYEEVIDISNHKVDKLYEFDNLRVIFSDVEMIFHQGAISTTTEKSGSKLLKRNVHATQNIIRWASVNKIPLSLASSASVYGNGEKFSVDPENEDPINGYAMSKYMVDNHIRKQVKRCGKYAPIQSWRYFNVYGERENHKGNMRSMVTKFIDDCPIGVFHGSDKIFRDFIYVGDVAKVVVNAAIEIEKDKKNEELMGVFNLGTGKATNVKEIADDIKDRSGKDFNVLAFPSNLKGKYQYFTEADMSKTPLPEGFKFKTVFEYIDEKFPLKP